MYRYCTMHQGLVQHGLIDIVAAIGRPSGVMEIDVQGKAGIMTKCRAIQ
jgi:hypothetical protein